MWDSGTHSSIDQHKPETRFYFHLLKRSVVRFCNFKSISFLPLLRNKKGGQLQILWTDCWWLCYCYIGFEWRVHYRHITHKPCFQRKLQLPCWLGSEWSCSKRGWRKGQISWKVTQGRHWYKLPNFFLFPHNYVSNVQRLGFLASHQMNLEIISTVD